MGFFVTGKDVRPTKSTRWTAALFAICGVAIDQLSFGLSESFSSLRPLPWRRSQRALACPCHMRIPTSDDGGRPSAILIVPGTRCGNAGGHAQNQGVNDFVHSANCNRERHRLELEHSARCGKMEWIRRKTLSYSAAFSEPASTLIRSVRTSFQRSRFRSRSTFSRPACPRR
jgi:hypothetical protein